MDIDNQPYTEVQSRIYSHLVLFALVVYDHMITLHREIHSVWLQKRTKGSTIFVVNRYALLSLVVGLLVKDHSRVTAQHPSSIHRAALLAVSYINVYMMCLFFFYAYVPAYSQRGEQVCAFVAYWRPIAFGVRIFLICLFQVRELYVATRICVILGDTLVVLLTWAKTYRNSEELHRTNKGGHTVTEYLMLDGILVSRFLLDLREALIGGVDGFSDISQAETSSQVSLGQENEQMLRDT
ncbi:hypothetical protein BC629DRAFT_1444043 [Irpex lacteus]|nr:hypothetical protein BC629DRAFT_1444043 [Irpex lacteus]